MSTHTQHAPILPGSWLGVFGGGQLGRMFTHAAQRMGYHVAIFDPVVDCPAAQAADAHFLPGETGEGNDESVLVEEMAKNCAAITLEFENIPVELLRAASHHTRVCPSADFLELCQDRISEKSQLENAGYPTTPFRLATTPESVLKAAEELSWPLVLKTARSGYDGKGQVIAQGESDLAAAWESLQSNRVIAEKLIQFDAEVSMITARNANGQIESYPLIENQHSRHILDVSRCPSNPQLQTLESQAQEICRGIAETFGVIGLFCVEFFVSVDGQLMINEVAPRPHNSGHLTIEGFTCSQFEQQVRAVCNLPLVPPQMLKPAAMANLLGDIWDVGEPNWLAAFSRPEVNLHLYGKPQAHAGRKMGHLTILDESSSEAAITAKEVRDSLNS
ncbi:MAG: 5-(carboxyamino)imidazole ribonucleotide synthase [Planctomycetales bacterium]|nr:5-(carboxyamino)imidazole ribonucleotide synthase [Planctomycetales bacterium]